MVLFCIACVSSYIKYIKHYSAHYKTWWCLHSYYWWYCEACRWQGLPCHHLNEAGRSYKCRSELITGREMWSLIVAWWRAYSVMRVGRVLCAQCCTAVPVTVQGIRLRLTSQANVNHIATTKPVHSTTDLGAWSAHILRGMTKSEVCCRVFGNWRRRQWVWYIVRLGGIEGATLTKWCWRWGAVRASRGRPMPRGQGRTQANAWLELICSERTMTKWGGRGGDRECDDCGIDEVGVHVVSLQGSRMVRRLRQWHDIQRQWAFALWCPQRLSARRKHGQDSVWCEREANSRCFDAAADKWWHKCKSGADVRQRRCEGARGVMQCVLDGQTWCLWNKIVAGWWLNGCRTANRLSAVVRWMWCRSIRVGDAPFWTPPAWCAIGGRAVRVLCAARRWQDCEWDERRWQGEKL